MKFIPILFSTAMVQAILDGRKTQTRRLIKQAVAWDPVWRPTAIQEQHPDGIPRFVMRAGHQYSLPWFKCPYGQPGDILWVRETWAPALGKYAYKADYSEAVLSEERNKGLWKPSIHMPKDACRTWLRVKSVRVDPLKGISEADAIAEGIEVHQRGGITWYNDYLIPGSPCDKAYQSFRTLWCSINGFESWSSNPWVWVVEFEKLDGKPEGF
jgi:hypothetical protein